MTFSKGYTRSTGSVRSKKSSMRHCFWPTPRSPRVKYCTWMAARTRANGDRYASAPPRKRLHVTRAFWLANPSTYETFIFKQGVCFENRCSQSSSIGSPESNVHVGQEIAVARSLHCLLVDSRHRALRTRRRLEVCTCW